MRHKLRITIGIETDILYSFIELYDLSRLSHIVLDEADTLLDDSFSSLSLRLLQKLKVWKLLILYEGFRIPV
jgi:superfamily II DNA/RNA helicase